MLIAFQEVEDGLALERYQIQRIERLNAQVSLAQKAFERLESQSAIGDVNYLDVLSANQTQQRLQRDTLSARLDLVLIRIGLYLALAGDFDTRPQATVDLPSEEALSADMATDQPDLLDTPDLPPAELPPDLTELPSAPVDRLPPVEPAFEIDVDE